MFRSAFHTTFCRSMCRTRYQNIQRFYVTHDPQSPSDLSSSTPESSTTPLPPRIQEAIQQINTFPEIVQASRTPDAQLATTLLHRILALVTGVDTSSSTTDTSKSTRPSMGKHFEAVTHALLAQHAHRVGDLPNERAHRLQTIEAVQLDADTNSDPNIYRTLLSSCHLSLAISCLRAPGAESQLAASAAATAAERLADREQHRLSATLLAALAAGPNSPRQPVVLSALTAMPGDPQTSPIDVPGLARYFIATNSNNDINGSSTNDAAIDHAKALVVRWEARGGFDYIEALCAAARVLKDQDGSKMGLEQAEDFLTRALKEAEKVGNQLDKSEPLLGMAQLYMKMGKIVETEGLFRSVEERFEPLVKKMAFTVSSADLYCRNMTAFASFLEKIEFNGQERTREANVKKEKAEKVRSLYPLILKTDEQILVPFWFVDSVLPHFEIPIVTGTQ